MPFIAIVYASTPTQAQQIRKRYETGDAGQIVGVYHWPSRDSLTCKGFCSRKGLQPWSRNRHGWIECGICKGRHVDTRKRFIGALLDYLGCNILRRDKTPKAFQNPQGWGL